MITALQISVFSVLLLLFSCAAPNPRQARAKQLFQEIDEIGMRQIGPLPKEEVMQALARLNEAKTKFPASRSEMIADAQIGREFFIAGISDNDQIISKYKELVSLGVPKANEDCFEISIKVQDAYAERMKQTLSQIELYFDESIATKETLDQKSSVIKEDGDLLDKTLRLLEERQKVLCSKSSLGVE